MQAIKPKHILLYGTLRRDQPAFQEYGLSGALRPAGDTFVRGQLYDFRDYPGLILGGSRLIKVERYEIFDRNIILVLDSYEGFNPDDASPFDQKTGKGSLFNRRVVEALGAPAYIYIYVQRASW